MVGNPFDRQAGTILRHTARGLRLAALAIRQDVGTAFSGFGQGHILRQDAQSPFGLEAMPAIGHQTGGEAEDHDRSAQQETGAPPDRGRHHEEGIDRETAQAEDEGHDHAMARPAIEQGARQDDIKPDRDWKEGADDRRNGGLDRSEIPGCNGTGRQEARRQRAQETGEQHQGQCGTDDEPEIPAEITQEFYKGLRQAGIRHLFVAIGRQHGRDRRETGLLHRMKQLLLRDETANQRYRDQDHE